MKETCPAPWMKILSHDGTQVPAGELKKGDLVRTVHEETGEWGNFIISHASTIMSDRITLTLGDKKFTCSRNHKFRDGDKWIRADQIVGGRKLDGIPVTEIEDAGYGEVVHIVVDEAHTYICEGFLSHNKNR